MLCPTNVGRFGQFRRLTAPHVGDGETIGHNADIGNRSFVTRSDDLRPLIAALRNGVSYTPGQSRGEGVS